ncbi:restriction endonuclease subunit S [Halomonas alkalicola]|uniref:Restriction endonuclease subunit S n=2 Tax=Halomonas alkalicola TaxID=1930622 RepID=A0ABY9H311_9GAMM|nr:restriction endonuclease subunit S [Halomonas alkalicola]WLI72857.1 restriction endonuclease subunit S [Halomonas alkalicola]
MTSKPFGELLSIPVRNGLTKPKKVRGQGFKMVNMGELFKYSRINNILMDRVPLTPKEQASSLLEAGDLLFARQSLVREGAGKCSIFLGDSERVCFESHLIRCRLEKTSHNPLFYYYYFSSPDGKALMDTIIEQGAGAAGIRGSDLVNLIIPEFALAFQNKIASILDALDCKIQLNRKINQDLEQMVQAIFKSWFVDFEPVKAKVAALEAGGSEQDTLLAAMQAISGKDELALTRLKAEQPEQYTNLRATAGLFPSELQDSELGEIPEGWAVESFSKIARLDTTSVKPAQEPGKIWEHYSIPAFDEGAFPAYDFGSEIKSSKYKVHPAAILSSKLNPHFPRTWVPDVRNHDGAICSTEFMQFVPLKLKQRAFIAGMVTSEPFQSGMMMRVTGSTGSRQRAQPKQVASMGVVLPPEPLMLEYSNRIASIYAVMARNIRQSQTLSQLRDTLLPKLLSGELSISNAVFEPVSPDVADATA